MRQRHWHWFSRKKFEKNVENRISTLSVARIQVDAIALLTAFVNVLSVTVKVAREKESGDTKKKLISWENEQEGQNIPEQFGTTKFWIDLQIALRIDSELAYAPFRYVFTILWWVLTCTLLS